MFMCRQKINFILQNFCVYLQAKNQLHPPCFSKDWLSAFWLVNWEPEFCQIQYGSSGEITTAILAFILDYFQEKLKFLINFSKNLKKQWGQFGPFLLKFGQKWIYLEKRTLPVFKFFNYLPSCQKSEKTNESFPKKKCWTDGWINRQQWLYRTYNIEIVKP